MVAASQPLAVQIGVDILKQGGSAVDAAIAARHGELDRGERLLAQGRVERRARAGELLVVELPGVGDDLLLDRPVRQHRDREHEVGLDRDELGAAHSVAPVVCAAGATARVAWYDQRDGPGDIYFNSADAAGP